MEDNPKIKKSFSWDIHWKCNFRCPYCWWHGRWEDVSRQNYYPGTARLIEAWKRIHDLYGQAHVDISGGEPTIYPGFLEFLSALLEYHTAGINTNLSQDAGAIAQGITSNLQRLRFNATFHPLFCEADEFIDKACFLQDRKFNIGVCYLAWPPQIRHIPMYRQKFEKRGFQLAVLTFWGSYNGKSYPADYTEEEKAIVSPNLGRRSGEEFQIEPLVTLGKKCNAGCAYATMHPDGKALRCGGGSWEKEDDSIGNLFDPDFKLLDEPRPCTSRHCPCNEWAFLLVEK